MPESIGEETIDSTYVVECVSSFGDKSADPNNEDYLIA